VGSRSDLSDLDPATRGDIPGLAQSPKPVLNLETPEGCKAESTNRLNPGNNGALRTVPRPRMQHRRQNGIRGRRLGGVSTMRRRPPSSLSIAMSICVAWLGEHGPLPARGPATCRVSGTTRRHCRALHQDEAMADDRTPRCVKLASKSAMMTTYRARRRAGNDNETAVAPARLAVAAVVASSHSSLRRYGCPLTQPDVSHSSLLPWVQSRDH